MRGFSRRFVIQVGIGLALPVPLAVQGAAAATDDEVTVETEFPELPRDLYQREGQAANRDFTPPSMEEGADPATAAEVEYAERLAAAAPYDCRPIDVARYFLRLGRGETKFGKQGASYAREWPVRGNPLIVSFFSATETEPTGDVTPWCAAFANWCIARSRSRDGSIGDAERKATTRSAASGSFRAWRRVDTPSDGDIVVFATPGTEHLTASGTGHVGFYLGDAGSTHIRVLGGNQRGQLKTTGAVTISHYPKKSADYLFYGYFAPKKPKKP